MNWRIPLAALFVVLALTGCAPSAGGSGQARTAPLAELSVPRSPCEF